MNNYNAARKFRVLEVNVSSWIPDKKLKSVNRTWSFCYYIVSFMCRDVTCYLSASAAVGFLLSVLMVHVILLCAWLNQINPLALELNAQFVVQQTVI